MNFSSSAGVGAAQQFDLVQTFLSFVGKQTGDTWKVSRFESPEASGNALLKGQLDATGMWADDYVRLKEQGADIVPWLTFRFKNGDKRSFCLWHNKKAGPQNVRSVMGKNLIMDTYWPMWILTLRELLVSHGIDEPLWKVFGSFTKAPNQNSAYMALALDKADYYWETNDGDVVLKQYFPDVLRKLSHTYCTEPEYSRVTAVLNRKSMGVKKVQEYRKWLEDMLPNLEENTKTDPRMHNIVLMWKKSIARFDLAGNDEFEVESRLYDKAKKNGWLDEFKFIAKKMDAVKPGEQVTLKPDYAFCRQWCRRTKKQVACVESCMK